MYIYKFKSYELWKQRANIDITYVQSYKISKLIKTLPTEIYHGKYRRGNFNAERRWLQVGGRPPPGEELNSRVWTWRGGEKTSELWIQQEKTRRSNLAVEESWVIWVLGTEGQRASVESFSGLSNQVALSGRVVLAIPKLDQISQQFRIASSAAASEVSQQYR